jgi:hypothetical protein
MASASHEVDAWSLQDGARAVRDLFKIIDDLVKHGGKALDSYRWYRRRKAARALNALRFREGGVLDLLRKIARGDFTEADVRAINVHLQASKIEVDESIEQLRKLVDLIREQISMEAAMRLEKIIEGPQTKGFVRYSLAELSYLNLDSERRGWDAPQEEAKRIVSSIEALNNEIVELHEVILRDRAKGRKTAKPSSPELPLKRAPAKKAPAKKSKA